MQEFAVRCGRMVAAKSPVSGARRGSDRDRSLDHPEEPRRALEAAGIPVITPEHPAAIVEDHGTVWRFQIFGDAKAWWDEHVAEAPRLGETHFVEHRFAIDLIRGLKAAGFRVEVR